MKKILTTVAVIIGLGLAIWISAVLFIGLAIVGAIGYGIYFARDFLTEKGILNHTPGIPPEGEMHERITIIEGDFTRVDENEKV